MFFFLGAEGFTSEEDSATLVQIETNVKRRFAIGNQVSVNALMDHYKDDKDKIVVTKVLQMMIRRGELQYRNQRKLLYRMK